MWRVKNKWENKLKIKGIETCYNLGYTRQLKQELVRTLDIFELGLMFSKLSKEESARLDIDSEATFLSWEYKGKNDKLNLKSRNHVLGTLYIHMTPVDELIEVLEDFPMFESVEFDRDERTKNVGVVTEFELDKLQKEYITSSNVYQYAEKVAGEVPDMIKNDYLNCGRLVNDYLNQAGIDMDIDANEISDY